MSGNYFFVNPSFLAGMARILDIGATFDSGSYLISATPAEADARARQIDWDALRKDLEVAMLALNEQTQPQEQAA